MSHCLCYGIAVWLVDSHGIVAINDNSILSYSHIQRKNHMPGLSLPVDFHLVH